MKIKDGMVIRKVAGRYVAVPTGKAVKDFSGLVRLNETGADVWNGIAAGLSVDEIVRKMVADYADVSPDVAQAAVEAVVDQLSEAGLVEK